MLPTLSIGPLSIPVAPMLWILAIWIGLNLAERWSSRTGIASQQVDNLLLVAFISGIMGARLSYVLQTPDAFASNLLSILQPSPLMLNWDGGALFAGLSAWIYIYLKRLPFWSVLDTLTPLLAVLAGAAALANLASGEGFGLPTQLPWSIQLWGAARHPSQIYELALAILVAILVWRGKEARLKTPGLMFTTFLALTCAVRIFSETFRGDSSLLFGSIRQVQILAWMGLAFSLWKIGKLNSRTLTKHPLEEFDGPDHH